MASDTKNVKIGVCKIIYDGRDMGYTQGGVEVTVKTDTHKVNVDQFGKSTVKEYLMGRDVSVKVPMAETTAENLAMTMPGTTIVAVGGAVATGTITVTTNPITGDTIVVNGATLTFKTAAATADEVTIGATAAATATNLAAVLSASSNPLVSQAVYSVAGAVVTIKWGTELLGGALGVKSVDGNAYTLGAGTAGAKVTLSGATLTGGTDPTSKSTTTTNGVGADLLELARELRLHPIGKPDTDLSDDFVIPLAATAGALTFAYKVDAERLFNVEFNGYPDPVTGVLFKTGA